MSQLAGTGGPYDLVHRIFTTLIEARRRYPPLWPHLSGPALTEGVHKHRTAGTQIHWVPREEALLGEFLGGVAHGFKAKASMKEPHPEEQASLSMMLSMALERTLEAFDILQPPMSKIKSTCGSKTGPPGSGATVSTMPASAWKAF